MTTQHLDPTTELNRAEAALARASHQDQRTYWFAVRRYEAALKAVGR